MTHEVKALLQKAATQGELALKQVPIDDLRPDPANPRRISDAELEALTRSIQEFGLVDPIIARREDHTVIGGHQRLLAARKLGLRRVPTIFVDLSMEQARLLNLGLNKISGTWHQELLAHLLKDLSATPDGDLSLSGFDEDEVSKTLRRLDVREKRDRPETFDLDAALAEAQAKPRSKRGQVWLLGPHRLMCGDSSQPKDAAKLMAGATGRLMVTDPPYGVDYETSGANPRWKKRGRAIANDDLGDQQEAFWTQAFSAWPVNGDVYVFGPSGPLMIVLQRAIEAAGIPHRQWLIWVKDRLVLGRSHFHYRHEHIFYGWRAETSWNGSRDQDSVWECDRPASSPHHPTTKPLVLVERAIESSSRVGDIVLDPFLGSGTALIACERTGRTAYAMELDPLYVDVAIARWEGFTGSKASLEADRA